MCITPFVLVDVGLLWIHAFWFLPLVQFVLLFFRPVLHCSLHHFFPSLFNFGLPAFTVLSSSRSVGEFATALPLQGAHSKSLSGLVLLRAFTLFLPMSQMCSLSDHQHCVFLSMELFLTIFLVDKVGLQLGLLRTNIEDTTKWTIWGIMKEGKKTHTKIRESK